MDPIKNMSAVLMLPFFNLYERNNMFKMSLFKHYIFHYTELGQNFWVQISYKIEMEQPVYSLYHTNSTWT